MYSLPNLFNLPGIFNLPNSADISDRSTDTYYSILGISNNASKDEIKKAYRKLSLDYHPDRHNNDEEKCEIFKKITEAYNTLSNDAERKGYDLSLQLPTNLNIDPSSLVNMFLNKNEKHNIMDEIKNMSFGKGALSMDPFTAMAFANIPIDLNSHPTNDTNYSQYKRDYKPSPIYLTITISLLEAYKSCKMPLNIIRWKMDNGTKIEQTETIYIDIPRGIDNNEIITIPNKGNWENDRNKGDVEVKININNITNFERNGIDLIFKKSITFKEALCGFSFDIKYIDGREFKINNEAGNVIPPYFRKIISNLGMQRDNDTGNLIIIFDIDYPKQLSTEQVEKLEKIL
jgi:DnaJ family protein B protein 4